MLDARSRVTVVGVRKRVDVALPTTAPIGEYAAGLADLCGQERRNALPAAWSLALAGEAALSLDTSLGAAGVTDGQILYLRDVARDPDTEPIVEDVGEIVAEQAQSQRDNAPPAGLVVIGFGLLWLFATGLLALWYQESAIGGALALIAAGLVMVASGWSLSQRETPVPAGLRLLVMLTAVPCLAAAGALVATALAGGGYVWAGAVGGANVAALMALAALPEAVIIALAVELGVAAVVAPVLIALHTNAVQTSATVVIVALAFLGVAKLLAAGIAAWSRRPSKGPASMERSVTELLIRSRRLLTVVLAGPTLALAVAFVVLAASRGGFAIALSAVVGVALLVRARQRGFTNELILIGGAGVVGLFSALVALMSRYHLNGTVIVAGLAALGAALIGVGMAGSMMRRQPDTMPVLTAAAGAMPGATVRPDRYRFIDIVGVLCNVAAVSLALGVFGVFDDLVGMGRAMVG
ncbi:EsaB/YukD family protein [Dactylosporangium sp. NPDC048998]|uniref:EsaB/YukD family protein n=1 Tax=Dactylosporangium sp. NPDC048998 TaxID=3363976 RepID=UPI00371C6DCC